jgi:hypothetical protein
MSRVYYTYDEVDPWTVCAGASMEIETREHLALVYSVGISVGDNDSKDV